MIFFILYVEYRVIIYFLFDIGFELIEILIVWVDVVFFHLII